jgi:hypothetical protein
MIYERGIDWIKEDSMRFRDKRQHKKKPEPSFKIKMDKFQNLSLVGEWQGQTLVFHPVSEVHLKREEKRMVQLFQNM